MALDLPPAQHATVATVVLEAGAPSAPRAPSILSDRQARALRAFAQARGLVLASLPADPAPRPLPVDPDREARLARVEAVLHAAREPIELGTAESAGALDRVRTEVAGAYAEIRAHPEDPEAPFLLGEALRTLARVEARAGDDDAATALRRRAAVVDGDRRVGLSEGGPLVETPPKAVPVRLVVDAPSGARVVIDGVPRDAGTIALPAGEHHVRVIAADGGALLARWASIGSEPEQALSLRVPVETAACSASDLSGALASTALDPAAPFAVSCARWLRVVRRGGALGVRVCDPTRCGPETTLSSVDVSADARPEPAPSLWRSGWTWAAIGATAVASGLVTAWGLGVFDADPRPPPTWRWEGAR